MYAPIVARARAALVLALCFSTVALAAEDPKRAAQKHYQEGSKAFDKGDTDTAIKELEAAIAASPSSRALLLLANIHAKVHHFAEARDTYKRLLEADPKTSRRADIEARVKDLDQILSTQLDLAVFPPGGKVFIDFRSDGVRGQTPLATPVKPGPHQVIIERDGYKTLTLGDVTAVDGQTVAVTAVMRRLAAPEPPAATGDGGAAAAADAPDGGAAPSQPDAIARAEVAVWAAQELAGKGDHAGAALKWIEAQSASPFPGFLLAAAVESERDGIIRNARRSYSEFLEARPNAVEAPALREKVAAFARKIEEEDAAEARRNAVIQQHLEAAKQHWAARRFDEAAQEFVVTYQVSQRPVYLYRAEEAYRTAGHLQNALQMLERFAAASASSQHPSAEESKAIARLPALRSELQDAIAAAQREEAARRARAERMRRYPILGRWQGIAQRQDGQQFKVIVDVSSFNVGRCAVVEYPNLGCSAHYECRKSTDGRWLEALEKPDRGDENGVCRTDSKVVMMVAADGTVSWQYTPAEVSVGEKIGSGFLGAISINGRPLSDGRELVKLGASGVLTKVRLDEEE